MKQTIFLGFTLSLNHSITLLADPLVLLTQIIELPANEIDIILHFSLRLSRFTGNSRRGRFFGI